MRILFNRTVLGLALLLLFALTLASASVNHSSAEQGAGAWYTLGKFSIIVMLIAWPVAGVFTLVPPVSVGKVASTVTLITAAVAFVLSYYLSSGSWSTSASTIAGRIGMTAIYIALALHFWNLAMDHVRRRAATSRGR